MSAELKSAGGSIALIVFGIAAFFIDTKWLLILVAAALLIWYGTAPALTKERSELNARVKMANRPGSRQPERLCDPGRGRA
jgi:hypothetical protein